MCIRDRKNIVIVAGFQGISKYGDITTLGRGGSDTSAVAIAAAMHADLCLLYTSKCCGNLSAVCNTACGNYRYIYCINNLRNKSHGCEITDMTA